jgi:hypothetical protein
MAQGKVAKKGICPFSYAIFGHFALSRDNTRLQPERETKKGKSGSSDEKRAEYLS